MVLTWKLRRFVSSVYTDLLLWLLWVLVVSLALLLPVYLGATFLLVRDCHPYLSITLGPDFLTGFNISNLFTPSVESEVEEERSAVESFLLRYQETDLSLVSTDLNLTVTAPVLPAHILSSGVELVEEFLEKYNIHQVSSHCRVNNVTEAPGLLSLAVGVCSGAIRSALGEAEQLQLSAWLAGLQPGTERDLVDGVISGNFTANLGEAVTFLPRLFPDAGIEDQHVSALQALVAPFETSELMTLLAAFRKANFTDKDLAVMEAVAKTAVDDFKNVEKVLKKIKVENLPLIVEKLDELGISIGDFITKPELLFSFFGDEEKTAILIELQDLLPKFRPADIEAILVLQEKVDLAQQEYGDPDAPSLMTKLFAVPMDVLLGALPKIKLDESATKAFDTFKLLMEDDNFAFLASQVNSLLDTGVQQKLLEDCTEQSITIDCKDKENDVCPTGHLFLGVASLAPLLLPGLLYALTTFLHYQGDIMQCGLGKPFNIPTSKLDRISAWIILLPLYMLFMIPWTLILIVYRQLVVCIQILKEIQGGNKVEADCEAINNASSFGLLYGAGQGVLHLGLQIVVVALLLGVGDTVLGLPSAFIHDHAIVSVISAGLGLVVLLVSYLSSQECGRLNRDLSTPHNSFTYLATSLWWLLSSTFISVFSTLLLCSLLYVDSLTLTRPTWLILPVVLLGLTPLLQSLLYHLLVKEGCEHRFAWGMFAAVTPVRFLETESRKTSVYLVWSQVTWLLSHSLAWLAYCVYSVLTDEADTLFRVWLPLIMPLLLIPPLTAALHWALSLSPLYTSRHAHPDMTRPDKRTLSFPPDWARLAGSNITPDSLARAGFFYSCRRLNTCEATCFSCGRQVTDWTNVKTAEMARMCSEHCPLYTENKPAAPAEPPQHHSNNVSCFAEFLFIASTMLFRIASVCLLLWVFMDQWTSAGLNLLTLVIIPPLYVFVLILFNTTTYFTCLGNTSSSSWLWALVSVLLPRPVKCSLRSARQLLVVNISSNLALHAFLWSALTGACTSCLSLSLVRLQAAWPILLVLALLSVLLSLPYYFLTVRLQPRQERPSGELGSNTNMVSTAL